VIDISIPFEKNALLKKIGKFSKYKVLGVEVGRMWSTKTTTILLLIGALDLIKRGQ